MKQCQLLAMLLFVLLLIHTNQFNTEAQTISEFLNQLTPSEEISSLDTESNPENFQSESATESEFEAQGTTPVPHGKTILQNWLKIISSAFGNNKKFPQISTEDGKHNVIYTSKFERKNPIYVKGGEIPSEFDFWFRLTRDYIYYSFTKKDLNIAGSLKISTFTDLKWLPGTDSCIIISDTSKLIWKICGKDTGVMTKWFCELLKLSDIPQAQDDKCDPKNFLALQGSSVVIKTITQPVIIIPLPSKHCNIGWNYAEKGNDWECLCKDGKEQSPIDLPPPEKAVETDVKPLFQYEFVDYLMTMNWAPAGVKRGEKNIIKYESNALRVRHPSFGKIVTLDGAVYTAQEIVFHTPSEHTIDGIFFDMEMEVIHYGKTIGDTTKQAILSILFKSQPGVFNKFIDKLNFFNLPNPKDPYRELLETLFIPHVFLDSEDEDLSVTSPFSFFTYQGSSSEPPCNEHVIRYIASKPIDLSNTALELFKEAIRTPDMMDSKGNVSISTDAAENTRRVQPLNGRAVFHYDHTQFACPDFKRKAVSSDQLTKGHYEKRIKNITQYIFVNGETPSGMPGAFVVPEKEANSG